MGTSVKVSSERLLWTGGGANVCSEHLGQMTKMAATPIYGKNPSKTSFSGTGGPISTKLGMWPCDSIPS